MKKNTGNGNLDKAAEGWMTFWDHPVHFIQNILGAEPEPYQADVLDALAESPRVAVRSGHGVGKTAVAAWAVTWFLVTRPLSKVPTTAPTFEKQVRDILWAEIHRWVRESVLARELSLSQTRMAVKGFEEEWFAVGMSAERPENLEGFHAPHLLYVVDEAKGVSDSIFDGIQGALTTDAKIFLISTPGARLGYFHQVFTKLRATWKTFHIPCLGRWERGSSIPSQSSITPRVSPDWIAARKAEWGESLPVYQARVLGEFPDEGEDTLIPLSHIESAMQGFAGFQVPLDPQVSVREGAPREADEPRMAKNRLALGVDVARYGSDRTVFTIIEAVPPPPSIPIGNGSLPGRLRLIRAREKRGIVEIFGEAALLAADWEIDVVAVDDTGVGGGVTDLLWEAGLEVLPIQFGAATSDADRFLNLKSEMFWRLRRAFETGRIALEASRAELRKNDLDGLVSQLSSMRYEIKPGGIRIVDPDEAARRFPGSARQGPVRSPDHAHSFALAWWAACGIPASEAVLLGESAESRKYSRRSLYRQRPVASHWRRWR